MLGKLIKNEFRATARLMWPIYAGIVLLSLFTRLAAIPILNSPSNFFFSAASVLVVFIFCFAMFALIFTPLVVSGSRFKKGVLGNEGYLTMTLPTNSHGILGARLINNVIWHTFTGILFILICVFFVSSFGELSLPNISLPDLLKTPFHWNLTFKEKRVLLHLAILAIEALLDFVAGVTLITLMVYVSYAIGYSANKHKSLWTVLLFYGVFHITCSFGIGTLILFGNQANRWVSFSEGVKGFESFLLLTFFVIIIISAIYYLITNYFIKNKLNLE